MARAWVDTVRRPAADDDVVAAISDEFPAAEDRENVAHNWFTVAQERRAALNLHAFTGLVPTRVDDGLRPGAVDLVLRGESSTVVVEVTSSASAPDEKAFDRSERLTARINALYSGSSHWALHFRKAYAPPSNRRRTEEFAAAVVEELRRLDQSDQDHAELTTASWLWARKIEDGTALVEALAWDARVPSSEGAYAAALRAFLHTDLIRSKQAKLLAEGDRLCATQRHLYVFSALTGANAQLFPPDAWTLAGASVALPDGIDVLWIDTRSAFTYRYSEREGVTVYQN